MWWLRVPDKRGFFVIILPFDRVTVIIIRCSRQLMQEIGWGFLGATEGELPVMDPKRQDWDGEDHVWL